MAAMDDADILHPTPERINFYRLTTLLIVGGKEIMRQVFDNIHPPRTLAAVLATVKSTIKRSARLTGIQMDSLYPPTGTTAVRSRDFDITLLFALLRNICNLTAPTKGWDEVPDVADESLVADLARIKHYRNEVYAHVRGGMEVSDDEFNHLWIVIKAALLRMVGTNDVHKRIYWKGHIDRLLHEPLEPADTAVLVQQFKEWHEAEMDEIRELGRSISNIEQNTAQICNVNQVNITFNFHTNNDQTTNKRNPTASSPSLCGANGNPGNAISPMTSADSNGSPFSEHYSSSGFQENYRRSVVPSGSLNQSGFFPNDVTGQIMPSSGSVNDERFPFPETPIPFASGSSVDNTGPRGAKPFFASTPNLPRNENVHSTHIGCTNSTFLPCNSVGGTSSSTRGFGANRLPPSYSPILRQSSPSPTHTQPWSTGDTSASVPMVPRSHIPVSSVSPSIPQTDAVGHDMFPPAVQSPTLHKHHSTSGGARPKTHANTPVGSASPSIPPYDAAGHGMFSTQSPSLQKRDSTSGGARPKTRPYTPNTSGSPPFFQSDTTGHDMNSTSSSLSKMHFSDQSLPWQERDSSCDGARRQSNDDIRRRASGGDLSHSIPQRYCGLPPNNVPSPAVDSIQMHDQYSAAIVQPTIPSNSERGCSASNGSIPQDAEECGRGYMSIAIRCEDVPADEANKAIEKIAKTHIRCSTQQGYPSQFQSYLEDNKNLVVVDCQVSGNQCTIQVQPLLLDALEELWKEYNRGDLRVIVQESLATPDVLQGITDCPCLQVEIDEKEYNHCYLTLSTQGQIRRSHTSSFDGGAPVESPIPRTAKSMPDLTRTLSFSEKSTTENAARELFDIVCQNGGSMKIEVALKQLSDESLQTITDLGQQNVIRNHANLFSMQPNGEIVNAIISVNFCKRIRDSGCTSNQCPDLHLCPFHLLNKCERTSPDCNRSHDANDRHTLRVFGNSLRLGKLSTQQRLLLLQKLAQDKRFEWEIPCNTETKVCSHYTSIKGCHNGDLCAYLHVCLFWVHGRCRYADGCRKPHNLESQHSRGILERDGINGLSDYEILERLQKINQLRARSATKP